MASGTVIFRPSADKSLSHSTSSGSNGYSLISESSHDDDSTYIYQTLSSTSNRSVSSTFAMAPESAIPAGAVITGVVLHVWAAHSDDSGAGSVSGSITVGGATVNLASKSLNANYSEAIASGNGLNQTAVSELNLTVTTSGSKASGNKASNGWVRVTQIYAEVTYEYTEPTGVGVWIQMADGTQAQGTAVYEKRNGVYVLTDKSAFDSNTHYKVEFI